MGGSAEFTDRERLLFFINVSISTFAGTMLGTALTTALPPIMKDYNISVNTAQWLTSGFNLVMSIIIPLTSFLITRFKTKRLFLTAIILFLSGNIIAISSFNFFTLLVGRIVQAGGSALISSMAQVITLSIFPPEKRGYYMGWYGLALNAAPIISPTIAGILVDAIHWKMIFILAAVIMLVTLIYTLYIFEDVLENKKIDFDAISFVLSGIAFGSITLAVGNFGTHKFISYHVGMVLLIGFIAGVIFTYRQLHIKIPFLDLRVFKHKDFTIAVWSTIIIQLILMGSAIIFPVYFQQVKGRSATISGLAVLPGTMALSIVSPFAGKIYDKIGIRFLFLFTGIVSTLSNLSLYFITIHTNIWVVSTINIARSAALGVLTMPVFTWGMRKVPESRTADGSATLNSFRILSMGVGSALFVSIMTNVRDYVRGKKENPDLYGINVVFLGMAILSFIVLLFGIFGCENQYFWKIGGKKGKDIKNSMEELDTMGKEDKKNLEKKYSDDDDNNKGEQKEVELVINDD
jgi:EmrB/QacA subfamily drug resistance transporter